MKSRILSATPAIALCAALSAGVPPVIAGEFETRSAVLPAPQRTSAADTRGLPPPDPQAELDRREARLRDHHLLGPPLAEPRAGALAAVSPPAQTNVNATNVDLLTNHAFTDAETQGITSHVDEPSVGARGAEVLFTGNWFAAFSTNAGASFSYVNPETTFPAIPNQPFCCDQVALYDAEHDLMVWFLQYVNNNSGNTGRLAVAQGNDIATQQWRFYDFTPQNVGGWNNEWFDYPDLAVGDDFLYITTNTFTTSNNRFTRAVILRIPLDELAAYQALNFDFFDTSQDFSLRPTQGAQDTMYFGSHASTSSLKIFTWSEASATISDAVVSVQAWSNATRVGPGPDGRDWLARVDSRITAAWRAGGDVGFAWTAAQDGTFPFPQVRVAIIAPATMQVQSEPHLWNAGFAYAYPAAAPNSQGQVGLSVLFGGGTQFHPSHAVGVLEGSIWRLVTTANGTHGPSRNVSGDYLAVRAHGADAATWVATGFTMQGGADSSNVEPRYVHFQLAGATPPPPPPPAQLQIALTIDHPPDDRLGSGQTASAEARVTSNGAPQQGANVSFRSSDPGSASVSPASAVTDASGIARTTVRGERMTFAEATIAAETDGVQDSKPIRVPSLSLLGIALLLVGLQFLGGRRE